MDSLTLIINLLSKTQGRDKALRLIQYATLNSKFQKGPFSAVYNQIRTTRKILRFLRTLQYLSRIKKQIPQLKKLLSNPTGCITKLLAILEDIFALLFFLSDHRVCLSELGMIDKQHRQIHYPKSMKYYLVQNILGAIKNVFIISVISLNEEDKQSSLENEIQMVRKIKGKMLDLIRCMLDVLIALFYWKQMISPRSASIFGVISSLIAISQSMKLI